MKIQDAWCADTSIDPGGWTSQVPERGQCAVTALVVQDLLGGEVLAGWVGEVRHYWNRIGDTELDLTFRQFRTGWPRMYAEVRPREVVLANADTLRRYLLLRERMGFPVPERFPA